MNILKEFSLDDSCSYLKDKKQSTHFKIIDACSSKQCEELIERGFRRFGKTFFRPICDHCDECKSIKIDVQNFTFSKSKRRVLNKADRFEVYIHKPTLTSQHLQLFEKYHQFMSQHRGWNHSQTNAQNYYNSFVSGYNDFGYEILYFDDDRLIAVDLIDILESGISSIYFYYDPDYRNYNLGKLSLYNQVIFAKERNLSWIYLGYYVKECQSLAYKSHYTPYLTLQGRPNLHEEYIWSSENQ